MTKELPLYACHKKVRALEIRSIGNYRPRATTPPGAPGSLEREVVFADADYPPIWVDGVLFARYIPTPGDYYVVYEGDGYASFSPRKAFLDGYTREGQSFAEIKQELKT
jgi:hypothetical protein